MRPRHFVAGMVAAALLSAGVTLAVAELARQPAAPSLPPPSLGVVVVPNTPAHAGAAYPAEPCNPNIAIRRDDGIDCKCSPRERWECYAAGGGQ